MIYLLLQRLLVFADAFKYSQLASIYIDCIRPLQSNSALQLSYIVFNLLFVCVCLFVFLKDAPVLFM